MRNPFNILRHEMTGLDVEILPLNGESYKMQGKVYKETRNVFLIKDHNNNIKMFPKNSIILTTQLDDGSVVKIDGNLMLGRSEERIKKHHKISFKF
ncbi:MAG: ribonuclease P protein subunit [Candidatus Altarchaeum sp.]|nr:ribonuclease P protein subunit [Candidatus Altarchaeum sp.]